MPTVSRQLPKNPEIKIPEGEARSLLEEWEARTPEALDRIGRRHPRFRGVEADAVPAPPFLLDDAQLVVAREYGFSNWAEMKERIDGNTAAVQVLTAIHKDDRETVVSLLRANPGLLHIPLWCGNWGPPMSHAANLGRLEIIKAVAALGARDFQHAFDRALLQGKLECARWLHEHGAKLAPGLVMGCCETLNPAGLEFLAELGAPFTDAEGNRLAPLGLALETYGRNPEGKHAVMAIFARQGYPWPDTPMMAFHTGNVARLQKFLRSDPRLISRRFSLIEIYPPELGCAKDGRSGMHWTPIDGTTLLHLAVDFDEKEIFDLLLEHGAEVNAHAKVDAEGFGGHTPIYNAVVSHGRHQASMARKLLERGASISVRASLRKFLDWCETPRLHEVREATPADWARTFPDKGWVNDEALALVEQRGARP